MERVKHSDQGRKEGKEARKKGGSLGTDRRSKKSNNSGNRKAFDAAFGIDFTNTTQAKEWESRHKEKLTRKTTPSTPSKDQVFHMLADKKQWSDNQQWSDEKIKQFLDQTLERHHSLLEAKNRDGYTPLHLALMCSNDAFIEAVLKNPKLTNLGTVLSQTCQYGNSLHIAIKHKTELIDLIVVKCAPFNNIFIDGQPSTNLM